MDEETVVFEIQVDKKVFEQLFKENKHFKDSYERLVKSGSSLRALHDEIATLKLENKNSEQTIKNLESENSKLKNLEPDFQSKKIEDRLSESSENVTNLAEELRKTKKLLLKAEAENRQLDKDNLNLELQVKNLSRKLRLEEERNKSNDLAHAECKLLKLKLQSVENEKKYLLEEFEKERKIISKQNKPRVAKLEENLKYLRRWIEKEARERRPHELEEVKSLKEQIHILENDKIDLIEGFELERKIFQKIVKANGNYDLP
ncbi:hypothetical protein Zmor_016477 [Zophobas morio]|uniref:Uncharacterized protein n=1 Tax=Zophobas morio TaxID=2755281 RepID=A0AA38I7S4_9CUCU|nr:hypothetical protein Zmor_016477 [Zophobas morio]